MYDDAGNVIEGSKRSWRSGYGKIQTRSYFGADGRLRAEQGYEEIFPTWYMLHERRGYFSEYRYDALGRRILVRTRRDGLCRTAQSTVDWTGGITRYVWSGDNILWEMRGPGADSVPAARLDEVSATAAEFGIVGYTHAGGVDRPLVVWKGATVVVPHTNWRGVFGKGTNSSGGTSTVAIEWPGFISTAYHAIMTSPTPTTNWMGSLIGGHRDPGGHMYMRNRYYDPATGQFTQPDPIGLAGGVNMYGFAAADPVTYHDPFGLKFCGRTHLERRRIEESYQVDILWDTDGCVSDPLSVTPRPGSARCAELQSFFYVTVQSAITFTVTFRRTLDPRTWSGSRVFEPLFGRNDYAVFISPDETRGVYAIETEEGSCSTRRPWGVHAIIVHELSGHGLDHALGRPSDQSRAIEWENRWNRIVERPERSTRCGGH